MASPSAHFDSPHAPMPMTMATMATTPIAFLNIHPLLFVGFGSHIQAYPDDGDLPSVGA